MHPRAALGLARPGNAVTSGAAVVLAAYVATGPALPWTTVLPAALGALAVTAAGNAANDAVDHAIDRRAHPERPIPRGEATPRDAWRLAGLLAVLGLGAAALAGALPLALAAAAILLLLAYELRLKRAGLPGNVVVALLVGATFLMGGLAAGAVTPVILLFVALAALATLGRELAKDLEDADADEGRATLPRTGHAGLARALAAGAFVAGAALSPFPYVLSENHLAGTYIALVVLADFGFLAAAWSLGRPHRASRLAKGAMLVAMAAFLLGRLTSDVIA